MDPKFKSTKYVDPNAETQPPEDIDTQEPSGYEYEVFGQQIEGDSEEEYITLSSQTYVDSDAETQLLKDTETVESAKDTVTRETSSYEVCGQKLEDYTEEEFIELSSSPAEGPFVAAEDITSSPSETPYDLTFTAKDTAAGTSATPFSLTLTQLTEFTPLETPGVTQLSLSIPEITTQDLGLKHELTFTSQETQEIEVSFLCWIYVYAQTVCGAGIVS
ncbi:uncharacterized protein LOC123540968 isoform X1 [Mercenaria mercenaria]|uniref:uncharacterized protein LOC123540968 isoform X1 n=1 Tax=Mercenaria mercenaria TaxID=6596 RepID=UPI00234EFD3C|nr:uncharacterized protein LOC123540968 isoform X1 [Mercenaria mercenaria]